MTMNRTEHKSFAVTLGVPEKIYDEMNATHEANNALIRRARETTMKYQPFQQRVVDEKSDLDTKTSALTAFLAAPFLAACRRQSKLDSVCSCNT
jgi:hypothetical protein